MTWIYIYLGILWCLGYSYSKPNGAPNDSCFYMTPRHIHPHTYRRVFPTRAMGLYNITTSADIFRPDRPIRVTLWGPPFKGFMLVAAEEGAKDWPTGIFYSDDGSAKRLSCLGRGDTVTHQNNTYKDSVSVLWYGPENLMSEQIQFIATVVVNLTIYYTNIKSGFVRLDPTLHAAQGGGENGPVAASMDPWLAGNSATRPPVNWWNRGSGGGRGGILGSLGSLLGGSGGSGGSGSSSWGSSRGSSSWGSGSGQGRGQGQGQGSNTWSSGSNWQQWGDGSVTSRSTWGDSSAGSSWGSTGNNWGGNAGGQGSWGSPSGNSWGSQSGNSWSQPSSGGGSWGSSSGSSWGSGSSSGTSGSGAGNQTAGGSSIWTWNSGPSTRAPPPKTSKAPPASAASGSSACLCRQSRSRSDGFCRRGVNRVCSVC